MKFKKFSCRLLSRARGFTRSHYLAGSACTILILVTCVLYAAAQQRDEIAGIELQQTGPYSLLANVQYTYGRSHAAPVYMGAWVFRNGKKVSDIGYTPLALSNWSGTAQLAISAPKAYDGETDELQVFLLEDGKAEPFIDRKCTVPVAWGKATAPAPKGPDLVITTVEVYPKDFPKHPGKPFTVVVYGSNTGDAPSGDYEVLLQIQDVFRGLVYPIGTFRKSGMQPGENYPVYNSNNVLVNFPGMHRVRAEIRPMFPERNTCNNVGLYAFTVTQ